MEREYILVTGCNGMVGSLLTRRLIEDGFRVLGISNAEIDLDVDKDMYRFEKVDLTDCIVVEELFEKYRISKIIHLAAIAHVFKGMDDSWSNYYRINTLCSKTIFSCAAARNIPVFFASTVDVFGITEGKVNESTAVSPIGNYAKSKAAAEELLKSICRESSYVIARFAPVYTDNNRVDIYKRCFISYPGVGYLIGGGKKYDFLSIKTAVDFMSKWARDGAAENGVFVVSDEDRVDTVELIKSEKAKGNAKAVIRIPSAVAGIILGIAGSVLGKGSKLCFSINKVLNPMELDSVKFHNYMNGQVKE